MSSRLAAMMFFMRIQSRLKSIVTLFIITYFRVPCKYNLSPQKISQLISSPNLPVKSLLHICVNTLFLQCRKNRLVQQETFFYHKKFYIFNRVYECKIQQTPFNCYITFNCYIKHHGRIRALDINVYINCDAFKSFLSRIRDLHIKSQYKL